MLEFQGFQGGSVWLHPANVVSIMPGIAHDNGEVAICYIETTNGATHRVAGTAANAANRVTTAMCRMYQTPDYRE